MNESGAGRISRRFVLRSSVAAAGGLAVAHGLAACSSSKPTKSTTSSTSTLTPVTTSEEALRRLLAGNGRFVAGVPINQGRDDVRRAAVAEQQRPFAVVLSCSDSRVPPEILFDEGIGDLFILRVAGNTAREPAILGSIEYAVDHLGSVLLMVLGHENCGAVKAAIDHVKTGAAEQGHIGAFVEPIIPAVQAVEDRPADRLVDAAVQENIRIQVQQLSASTPFLAPLVSETKLKVVGAEYHLASGQVEVLS